MSATTVDIGIDMDARTAIAGGLARVLADTYTLYLKTHGYHWNVTGPHFQALHTQFEAQYRELWAATDLIAERMRALGVFAPGSYAEFATLAEVKEADGVPGAESMVADLARGHERVAKTAREAFPAAEEANDQPTMDLLTERMTASEKAAWMLRSFLQ